MGSIVLLSTQCLQQPTRMLIVISILVLAIVCDGIPYGAYFPIDKLSAEGVGATQTSLFLKNVHDGLKNGRVFTLQSVEKQVSVKTRYIQNTKHSHNNNRRVVQLSCVMIPIELFLVPGSDS